MTKRGNKARCLPGLPRTSRQALERPTPSLISARHPYSNRNCYEKLELDVSGLKSITSIFLIATKSHFFELKNAQF